MNKKIQIFLELLNWNTSRALPLLLLALGVLIMSPGNVFAATQEQRSDVNTNSAWRDAESSALRTFCSGASSNGVASDLNLGETAEERQVAIVNLLISEMGLTAEQASGIVGNMIIESGTPEIYPDVNQGGVRGPPSSNDSGGKAYGWVQWDGGRKTAFLQFAIENGYIPSRLVPATDGANFAYLKHELTETTEKAVLENLKKTSTPEDAAVVWLVEFERARDRFVPSHQTLRGELARRVFDVYSSSSANGSGALGGCTAGGVAIVGDYAFPLIIDKSGISNASSTFKDNTAKGDHGYSPLAYDLYAPEGTPVVSLVSGTVTNIGRDKCPGRAISIYSQDNDFLVWYGHLGVGSEVVAKGDKVDAGQLIGYVGNLKASCDTIEHLHIDVSRGDSKPRCTRENCPRSSIDLFVDFGPQLFETFQALPE